MKCFHCNRKVTTTNNYFVMMFYQRKSRKHNYSCRQIGYIHPSCFDKTIKKMCGKKKKRRKP